MPSPGSSSDLILSTDAIAPKSEEAASEETTIDENPSSCPDRSELERQVQLATLLNEINVQLSSTLDLDEVLSTACRLLCRTLKCNRASVLVREEEARNLFVTRGEYNDGDYPSQLGIEVNPKDNAHLQALQETTKAVAVERFSDFPGLGEASLQIVESLQIRSMLAIATRHQGEVNGIIGLHQCDRERVWQPWEQQLLEGVARQLGIAIDRARLYKATRDAAAQEAFLRLVTNKVRNTLDTQTILQTAVQGARRLLQADRVVIYQFHENWHGSVVVEDVVRPWTSVLGNMGADDCFSGEYAHLYREGRVRAIDDVQADDKLDRCHVEFLERLQVRANLIVPILLGKPRRNDLPQLWGLLIAHHCRAPRRWKTRESHLMTQLADQLAIAIGQADLYAKSQAQAQRESLLRLMTDRVRRSLDLPEILQTAVTGIRDLLETDRVVVYQFVEGWQGEVVVEDVARPEWSILTQETRDDCFHGEHAQLYLKGRVRAIDDIHTDPELDVCHRNFLHRIHVKANLIVPIVTRRTDSGELSESRQLWGLLLAQACESPRPWKPTEIELLSQLAEQVAIAVQQSELYTQTKAQAQELRQTLDRLQSTQLQLIQSEKLSGLGKMAAGVAHEINNANNFIFANLHYASEYGTSLLEGIETLDIAEVEELKEDLDFDYLREDFPKVMKSMKDGSQRISSVVNALQTFSHLNEAELKPVDLHECLDSSLVMLQRRFKSDLKVCKQYDETLPEVECRPGQINQVFFNLIENALDVLEDLEVPGQLTLRTERLSAEWVRVAVRDNGPGIPETVRDRVFDPFFTTKSVGKGTGLGLSTCYQVVVQAHGGKLYVNDNLSSGTEIVIELPVAQEDGEPR
ncbi:GAF domain-containing sensor histidine kinase [Baaleninema sp.]|uniref:GAF domain-containing sensor histidine kinase n=1 Tax=Baaleninema sp. TaxID=3101197 RepID=UPI003D07382A